MADEKQNAGSCCQTDTPSCGCSGSPMRWVWLLILVGVVIFVVTRSGNKEATPEGVTQEASGPGIVWQDDYAKAMQQAKQENKPVLLAFHASWCGPCKQMKNVVYHDSEVIKAAEPFVRVLLDVDKTPQLASQYQVSPIPAYRILGKDGAVVENLVGAASATEFTAWLKAAYAKTLPAK